MNKLPILKKTLLLSIQLILISAATLPLSVTSSANEICSQHTINLNAKQSTLSNHKNLTRQKTTNALFLGDSQTDGRAKERSAKSSVTALINLWKASFETNLYVKSNGASGRTLEGTHRAYLAIPRDRLANLDWVHFQESGNQLSGGGTQNTPEKYAKELEKFIRSIRQYSPDAVITTETAYSFEAEKMKGRDWTKYNIAQCEVIKKLMGEGIFVAIAPVDHNIKELVFNKRIISDNKRGQEAVWGDTDNRIRRHYTGLGNLMVAISIFQAINADLNKLDLSDIPNHEISERDKKRAIKTAQKRSHSRRHQ